MLFLNKKTSLKRTPYLLYNELMVIMPHVITLLSFWCTFACIHCQIGIKSDCEELVYKKTEITGVLFTGFISVISVSNVQECANRCPDYSECRSFGFDMASLPHKCYLYRNHVYWGEYGLDYSSVYYYWQVERKCPVNQGYTWNADVGICFKIFPKTYGSKSWFEAQSECENWKGNLFIPDTNDKLSILKNMINNEYTTDKIDEFIFVGMNDFHRDALFYWLNGGNVTNWEKYQPDNLGEDEHCGALRYRNPNLDVIDTECHPLRSFICEIQVIE